MAGKVKDAAVDPVAWDEPRLASPHDQADKAQRVRRMFDAIAGTYQLVNSLASLGLDAYWRREMVRLAAVRPDDVLLDVACGTGEVARAFASAPVRPGRIIAVDFSRPMLARAAARPIIWGSFWQADALHLPVADASVSIVTCAFGIRNFQVLGEGLSEMYRVLRVGGRAVVLEFALPRRPLLRRLYLLYFTRIMPMAATLVSRDRTGAYRYLPRSVVSFPDSEGVVSTFQSAGFGRVAVHRRSGGIVTLYVASKTGGDATVRR